MCTDLKDLLNTPDCPVEYIERDFEALVKADLRVTEALDDLKIKLMCRREDYIAIDDILDLIDNCFYRGAIEK